MFESDAGDPKRIQHFTKVHGFAHLIAVEEGIDEKKRNILEIAALVHDIYFAPYINGVIKDFEKENPDIKIKWVDVPFSEGEKRTLASILSDNPPDLVNLNPDFSAILAQKGALAEISDDKVEQFSPEIINSLKYNDKLYAVPWYATSAVTIYNKELFDKAGLWYVPKTYEKVAKYSQLIKDKTGAYIFMPTITENDTMLKILNKYGINSSDTIASDESIRIFDFYKDLYQKK